MLKEENRSKTAPLPPKLDGVVARNSDGTSTITEDIEVEFGEGTVFRIPKGTVIESGGIVRVGANEVQIVDAAGSTETFPPGHAIGFSYFDKDTSKEGSFDILGAIEEQQKKKQFAPGCNTIGGAMLQTLTLMLLVFLGIGRRTNGKSRQ